MLSTKILSSGIPGISSRISKDNEKLILVLGRKGGTGKSQFVINLLYVLSEIFKEINGKLLGIDIDKQNNLLNYYQTNLDENQPAYTFIEEIKEDTNKNKIYRVLKDTEKMKKLILRSRIINSIKAQDPDQKYIDSTVDILADFATYLSNMQSTSHEKFIKNIKDIPGYALKIVDISGGDDSEQLFHFIKTAVDLGTELFFITHLNKDTNDGLAIQLYKLLEVMGKNINKAKIRFVYQKYHEEFYKKIYKKIMHGKEKSEKEYHENVTKQFISATSKKLCAKYNKSHPDRPPLDFDFSKFPIYRIPNAADYDFHIALKLIYSKFNPRSEIARTYYKIAHELAQEMLGVVHISTIKDRKWMIAFETPENPNQKFLKWRKDSLTEDLVKGIGGQELLDLWKKSKPFLS
ncbi:AAA family ATPase [Candidatus Margulisiibacteriota bacterium]